MNNSTILFLRPKKITLVLLGVFSSYSVMAQNQVVSHANNQSVDRQGKLQIVKKVINTPNGKIIQLSNIVEKPVGNEIAPNDSTFVIPTKLNSRANVNQTANSVTTVKPMSSVSALSASASIKTQQKITAKVKKTNHSNKNIKTVVMDSQVTASKMPQPSESASNLFVLPEVTQPIQNKSVSAEAAKEAAKNSAKSQTKVQPQALPKVAPIVLTAPIKPILNTGGDLANSAKAPASNASVVLKDILVHGLERSDAKALFNLIPAKVGQSYLPEKDQEEVVKALYASGLYQNVDVKLDGDVLDITLSERPVISEVKIIGMKHFDQKMIFQSFKKNGISQGRPFDPIKFDQLKTELRQMYESDGLIDAVVTSNIVKQDKGQVALSIVIKEGEFQKIDHIEIIGNKALSTRQIKDAMDLSSTNMLSWITSDNRFSNEKFQSDLEKIRNVYLDKGYLDFDVIDVKNKPSAKKTGLIDLALTVSEGKQYRISGISVGGDTKSLTNQEIAKITKYEANGLYSRTKIASIVDQLREKMMSQGYALTQIDVVPKIDTKNNLIQLELILTPGERIYVRQIHIQGNGRTRDDVIRREVLQMEAALYDHKAVEDSRNKIARTGYFDNVEVTREPVAGSNNQIDVTYTVHEVLTGSVKFGVGYSSSDKVTLNGTLSENNFLGTGQSVNLTVDTSKASRDLSLSVTNPYFTKSGISQSVGGYYRKFDASENDLSDTKYTTIGGRLIYGIPVSEKHRVYLGINPERNKIKLSSDSPKAYWDFIRRHEGSAETVENFIKSKGDSKSTFDTYGLTAGWSYDSRNSGYLPTKGMYHRVFGEISPFGRLNYYKLTYQYQQFLPVSTNTTLAFNSQVDYAKGYGSSAGYPFYKNLFAGGLGTVRGYESGSVGPQDAEGNLLGGSKRAVANVEYQFPFPGLTNTEKVKLFTFADAAGLWSENDGFSIAGSEGMRYSYGAGLLWISPMGPLKFSYGNPIRKKDGDKVQRFQFQVGTSF